MNTSQISTFANDTAPRSSTPTTTTNIKSITYNRVNGLEKVRRYQLTPKTTIPSPITTTAVSSTLRLGQPSGAFIGRRGSDEQPDSHYHRLRLLEPVEIAQLLGKIAYRVLYQFPKYEQRVPKVGGRTSLPIRQTVIAI